MKHENEKPGLAPIPEPSFKIPFLGHLLSLKGNTLSSFINLYSKLGPIYRLHLGSYDIVVITSFELVKEVCDDSRFDKYLGVVFGGIKTELLKDGIGTVLTNEPIWGIAHRILMSGFTQKAVQENHFKGMAETVKTLLAKWDNTPNGKEINLNDEINRTTLDIVCLCGFDFRFNAISSKDVNPFINTVDDLVYSIIARSILPNFLNVIRFRKNREINRTVALLYDCVDDIIEGKKGKVNSPGASNDFLSAMLNDVDKITGQKLDIANIRNQIMSIIFAGHLTSAGLISFAFYALMTYPDVRAKAYAEVDAVLGTDLNKPPEGQDFLNLTYITRILNECLRLWPPAALIERCPIEDTLLGGKYPVKKGQCIWQVISVVQRDKAIWGMDADLFNPDRFAPELVASRDPCSFIPFGTGKRGCLGRQFAMFEASVIVGMILQRYRLHLKPDYQFKTITSSALRPSTMWVTLEKRQFN